MPEQHQRDTLKFRWDTLEDVGHVSRKLTMQLTGMYGAVCRLLDIDPDGESLEADAVLEFVHDHHRPARLLATLRQIAQQRAAAPAATTTFGE